MQTHLHVELLQAPARLVLEQPQEIDDFPLVLSAQPIEEFDDLMEEEESLRSLISLAQSPYGGTLAGSVNPLARLVASLDRNRLEQ